MKTKRIELRHPLRHGGIRVEAGAIVELSPMVARALITTGRARIIFEGGVPSKNTFERDWEGDPVQFIKVISTN